MAEPFATATPGWGLGDGALFDEVDGIAVGDDGSVFLFGRWPSRVDVRRPDGALAASHEAGFSDRPHGLALVGEELYCVDAGASAIVVLDRATGAVVRVIGTRGHHSDTGVDWEQPDTLSRLVTITGGPPFNRPTDVTLAPDGSLLVSDGYGNCRIHRMTPDGDLVHSWGRPGRGSGQLNLPHGIAVDGEGRAYVADRENDRVQVFDRHGEVVAIWDDMRLPTAVAIGPDGSVLVAEVGMPAWRRSLAHPDPEADRPPRVSVRRPDGAVVAEIGEPDGELGEPGVLVAPHAVAVGPQGEVYVGELAAALASARGIDRGLPAVQRFTCRW